VGSTFIWPPGISGCSRTERGHRTGHLAIAAFCLLLAAPPERALEFT
jgi:hypothetical protein